MESNQGTDKKGPLHSRLPLFLPCSQVNSNDPDCAIFSPRKLLSLLPDVSYGTPEYSDMHGMTMTCPTGVAGKQLALSYNGGHQLFSSDGMGTIPLSNNWDTMSQLALFRRHVSLRNNSSIFNWSDKLSNCRTNHWGKKPIPGTAIMASGSFTGGPEALATVSLRISWPCMSVSMASSNMKSMVTSTTCPFLN